MDAGSLRSESGSPWCARLSAMFSRFLRQALLLATTLVFGCLDSNGGRGSDTKAADSGLLPDAGNRDADGGHDAGLGDELTSQHRYSYPGCEDAGTYGCPNLPVFYCAMRAVEGRHNSCSVPSDCVAAPIRNCVGALSSCPPAAVTVVGHDAFVIEAQAEVWRYCGDGGATCVTSGSCGYAYSQERATCVNGRCVPVLTDGGQP